MISFTEADTKTSVIIPSDFVHSQESYLFFMEFNVKVFNFIPRVCDV
jgi:hypothetical protein